jgi:hypothetical protein
MMPNSRSDFFIFELFNDKTKIFFFPVTAGAELVAAGAELVAAGADLVAAAEDLVAAAEGLVAAAADQPSNRRKLSTKQRTSIKNSCKH